MSSTRQDAWSQDDDLLLAEVVLRHLREGRTQLQAFEEVGKSLSRTASACGFRWNSSVRKQYQSDIETAKKVWKQLKSQPTLPEPASLPSESATSLYSQEEKENGEITFQATICFLNELYKKTELSKQGDKEKIKELEKKTYELVVENEKLEKKFKSMEEDYRILIDIMERARKMITLQDRDHDQKAKFQMAKNGNLERVE
ncbi:RsfA family transcriptional regulator [Bacillus sp. EB600]|uniref:RsfA family transcriptional regulator n=1 Tax=Bacillus sp. EB600 TaxID=2806345 RepID=UPI00210D9473|nr:RsfA family transcriptional regulator [Bacillus sp. EB600]MCQ6282481.1 RsfA family transcriptional regulator [Bacillus sp. EB600]